MKKRILNVVLPFFTLIRDIFPYVLLIYLIFFLLENLLPGFISNNFDLNNLLVVVLILGFFSVFAPIREEKEEPTQKNDLYLIIGLSILSFLILFFKTIDMGIEGIVIALGGSILVAFMSAIIVYSPEEEEEEFKDEVIVQKKNISHVTRRPKLHLFKYFKLAIPLFIIVIIVIGLLIYKPSKKNVVKNNLINPPPTVISNIEDEETIKPDEETLQKTSIEILNGSPQIGSASAMGKFLKDKGFNVTTINDANRKDYQGALIRFRPEEYELVKYLIQTIQDIYPNIIREPLESDKANVILILGKP